MDPSSYKTVTVSRGYTYNFYFAPAQSSKPYLLFCHGFPSTSRDWQDVVPYFQSKGYGLVVPDLLGYGGTDKPSDPAEYVSSKMVKDLVDLLDAAGVQKVVAIGHDWGTKPVSRLSSYAPERVSAYAFLSVPFIPPRTESFEEFMSGTRQLAKRDLFGYWYFFNEDDADKTIRAHIDSFAAVIFPQDPDLWLTQFAPVGALKNSLLEDYKGPVGQYLPPARLQEWKDIMLKPGNGFVGPTCWYKVMVRNLQCEDDKLVPPERAFPPKTCPIFFAATLKDRVCVPEFGYHALKAEPLKEHDITIRDFDSSHWVMLSHAKELCKELESWLEGHVVKKANM